MSKSFKFLTSILVLPLLLMIGPTTIEAHVGGVPFLDINSKAAIVNPFTVIQATSSLLIPQDLGPENYAPGQELSFEIDTKTLGVSLEVLKSATFRWSFEEGSTDYSFGTKVTHTYSQTGSKIIHLSIKAAADTDFTLYDVIQVEIVPHRGYQTPKAQIRVEGTPFGKDKPMVFQADFQTDPSTQIETFGWYMDGQKVASDPKWEKTFTEDDFFKLSFLEYKDKNGFRGYGGVWIEAINGKVDLPFPPNDAKTVKVIERIQSNPANTLLGHSWVLVPATLLIIYLGITYARKRSR